MRDRNSFVCCQISFVSLISAIAARVRASIASTAWTTTIASAEVPGDDLLVGGDDEDGLYGGPATTRFSGATGTGT